LDLTECAKPLLRDAESLEGIFQLHFHDVQSQRIAGVVAYDHHADLDALSSYRAPGDRYIFADGGQYPGER